MPEVPAFSEKFLTQYEIVEALGEGAFGAVFRCRQRFLNREGALKILKSLDLEQVRRFIQREVALLARLDHPNVLKVLDAGVDRTTDGTPIPYVVTELVGGGTLEQLLARERLTLSRALEISIQVAEGLHHAHGAGIVHRDVKPANIFLDPQSLAKVADFGLARPIAEGATLTTAGQVVGTPSYIAPEQVLGHRATHAADQYAVGVTLFQMITCKLPFSGINAIEILTAKVKEEPPRARTFVPHLPPSVDALILRSMARNPSDRFPDLKVLADEARKILDQELAAARTRQAGSTSTVTPTLWAATATRSAPPTPTASSSGAPTDPVAPTDINVLRSSLSPAFAQRYRLDSILGAGAMGMVAKGEQLDLTRQVAIKFPTVTGESQVARFIREGKLLSKLSHPNLVRVYDVGEDNGHLFIVSEFVPGHTLRSLIRLEGLEVGEAAALVVQLLEGLAHAHEQNVIHRDVKSDNILVTEDALVKLLDFGLAKSLESVTMLTREGAALGTAAYMSPEAARGQEPDQRTDLYSAGIVLYELLTGHVPFRGNAMQVMFQQVNDLVPPITKQEVPDAVRSVVTKALAKQRDERYSTARDFAADLIQATGLKDRRQNYVLSALSRAGISLAGVKMSVDPKGAGDRPVGSFNRTTGRTPLRSGQFRATASGRFKAVGAQAEVNSWPTRPYLWISSVLQQPLVRRCLLLIPIAFLIGLGAVIFFAPGNRQGVQSQLYVEEGLSSLLARWETAKPCLTEVELFEPNGSSRRWRNNAETSATRHTIVISDLVKGSEYKVRVVQPDGGRSEPVTVKIPTVTALLFGSPEAQLKPDGTVEIVIKCTVPAVARMRYQRGTNSVDGPLGWGFARQHRLVIQKLGADEEIRDLKITIDGVDKQESLSLAIMGGPRLARQFSAAVREVPDGDWNVLALKLIRTIKQAVSAAKTAGRPLPVGKDLEAAQQAIGVWLKQHNLDALLTSLRLLSPWVFKTSGPELEGAVEAYRALLRFEDFDALGANYGVGPLLDIAPIYRSLVVCGEQEQPGPGIILLDNTSGVRHYLTGRYRKEYPQDVIPDGKYFTIGGIARGLGASLMWPSPKFQVSSTFDLTVGKEDLSTSERFRLMFQVANLRSDVYLEFAINDRMPLRVRNNPKHARDFDYKSILIVAKDIHYVAATLPTNLLTPGKNQIRVTADTIVGRAPSPGASLLKVLYRMESPGRSR